MSRSSYTSVCIFNVLIRMSHATLNFSMYMLFYLHVFTAELYIFE